MADFQINRGIGRSVEFQGLKAHYLFIFVGGLVGAFFLSVALHLMGFSQLLSIGVGVAAALLLVWQTFSLNAKYGEHGMMKRQAKAYHPRYIISRRKIPRLFNQKDRRDEK
ncbi:MAG: DUF4133 domain-containing protein [Rikenellaceae bacterium]